MKKIFLTKVKAIEDFFENKVIFIILAFSLLVGLFLIKLGNILIDQTLWGEDGSIFVSQSLELGIKSIWKEYSGYLHLYPRIVSYFASFFDLSLTPIIFLIFCSLAYAALVWVIINKGVLLNRSRLELLLLAILIIFQPHSGEVFFNLTNAQWWTASALFILVCCDGQEKNGLLKSVIIFIASVTGPFSLFLLPILAFNSVILRNWRNKKFVYIPVLLGGFIQLIFILNSHRIHIGESLFENKLEHLLFVVKAIISNTKNLIFFGSDLKLSRFFSIILWLMIFSQVSRVVITFAKKNKNNEQDIQAILLLFLAAICYASSIFVSTEGLSPLGSGGRYFFTIYSLIFFAAWLLFLNNKILRAILLLIILLIDCLNNPFRWGKERLNHQFQSYVEFSKFNEGVEIRYNPYSIPNGEVWKITLPSRKLKKISDERVFEAYWKEEGGLKILDNILFSKEFSKKCSSAKHLGIELRTYSIKGGKLQLIWSGNETSLTNFLDERFFSGESKIYFAIPLSEGMQLKLKRFDAEDDFEIKSTRIYCL